MRRKIERVRGMVEVGQHRGKWSVMSGRIEETAGKFGVGRELSRIIKYGVRIRLLGASEVLRGERRKGILGEDILRRWGGRVAHRF